MSADFEPVKLGPRRRRLDPVAVGVAVVAVALIVAVVKPWGDVGPGPAGGPSPAPASASPKPPAISIPGDLVPPTWADVRSVISRRSEWGIRTIVMGPQPEAPPGTTARYSERWVAADANPLDGFPGRIAVVDERDGSIVALGVTFPPEQAPLALRIWRVRAVAEPEWIDTRPVDVVPARGAYLLLRRSGAEAAVHSWAPGRYRIDLLAGGEIRRVELLIRDASGDLPDPKPWPGAGRPTTALDGAWFEGLPVGLFAQVGPAVVPLASSAGPALDEAGAWLDLDPGGTGPEPGSFVARSWQPRATRLGVVLPPASTVRSAVLRRLAPFDDTTRIVGETTTGSGESRSYVAFAPATGATWRPGVYAITVVWEDGDGAHDRTWHVELRPGPVSAEPALLSATRAWARYAGAGGVLLGTTESRNGGLEATAIRLVPITPQTGTRYPGLSGTAAIGCGGTFIRGRPTLIGLVGPDGTKLTPVASRILFPFADAGPLPILTAAGAVPGLVVVAPLLTAEFGGPAAYGFRAGSGGDAPGYTVCVGLAPPAG